MYPRVIYEIRHETVQPLAMIFNSPTIWKCANISPIHKKGRKNEVNNYRPVSLTCIHTLQSHRTYIVRDKVLDHFVKNKLFTNKKFGFFERTIDCHSATSNFKPLNRNIGMRW